MVYICSPKGHNACTSSTSDIVGLVDINKAMKALDKWKDENGRGEDIYPQDQIIPSQTCKWEVGRNIGKNVGIQISRCALPERAKRHGTTTSAFTYIMGGGTGTL